MAILTEAAVLLLATTCQTVVAPETILKIATIESHLDASAVHKNDNGSVDRGLMQINSANDSLVGLRDPFDPCQSIHAAGELLKLFSAYNTGSPTKGITNGYALKVAGIKPTPPPATPAAAPPDQPTCAAPPWDTWGRAECEAATSTQIEKDTP